LLRPHAGQILKGTARLSQEGGFAHRRNPAARPTLSTQHQYNVEMTMDWNRVEGNWKQTKGKIKEKWGQLTDDDLTTINGKRDQLEGKIQQRYGLAKDMVRKDVDDWLKAQDKAA
jgi:uncharacterized protein YjbJ (UPF0337 family)